METICGASCTVTHVISIDAPLLSMTTTEAGEIGLAVAAVWAVAFGFRVLIQLIKSDGVLNESDE